MIWHAGKYQQNNSGHNQSQSRETDDVFCCCFTSALHAKLYSIRLRGKTPLAVSLHENI